MAFSSRTAVFAVNLFYTDHYTVLPASSILLINIILYFKFSVLTEQWLWESSVFSSARCSDDIVYATM